MFISRTNLVEKTGILHIYYANKTFKHWKKRWLHLQDQQLAIHQGKTYILFHIVLLEERKKTFFSSIKILVINVWKIPSMLKIIVYQLQIPMIQYHIKDIHLK